MSADQVLHRGAALELQRLGDGGAPRRPSGRLAAASAPRPALASASPSFAPERAVLDARGAGPELERQAVELRRPGRRPGPRRPGRPPWRSSSPAFSGSSGRAEVGAPGPRDRPGPTPPAPAPSRRWWRPREVRRERRDDRLADPVVIGLDLIAARPGRSPGPAGPTAAAPAPTRPSQASSTPGRRQTGGSAGRRPRRPPGAAALVGQPEDPRPEHLVEVDLAPPRGGPDARRRRPGRA